MRRLLFLKLLVVPGETRSQLIEADIFVSAGLRFALWGILEANTSLNTDPVFSGLAGVLPAKYVAETVKAMGAVQDKALRGVKKPD